MTSATSSDQPRSVLQPPPNPTVRLVERSTQVPHREWDTPLPSTGRWRISGDAGSGKSSLLVDIVVAKIRSGADPSGLMVVAPSKPAAGQLRRAILGALTGEEARYVAEAPLVRSVHSLAFALLRSAHNDNIRMITGADQDAVIQDLLAGHAEDGRGSWPVEVRPALTFVGFARQLRDVLLRSAERGLTGPDLAELGKRYHRPLWVGAGEFQAEYDQIVSLSDSVHYSASELVAAAAATDAPENHTWHTVVVDDAQHIDPTSGELLARILPSGSDTLAVVAGDPEQSVFRFRGATTDFFEGFTPDPGQDIDMGASRRTPERSVMVVESHDTLRLMVADHIRRAHLLDGVAWSDMAVIVRSTSDVEPLRRALLGAGVPVHINPTDVVLAEQHIVVSILLGLRALQHELSHSELEALILGPVGGADPVTLRRLLRGLRRFDPNTRGIDTLAELLAPSAKLPDFGDVLTEREHAILDRLRSVLEAGRASLAAEGTVEEILWAVWEATGLAERLMATALRGGAAGSQADRDLDSMMALFDAAGDFVERYPTSSIDSFIQHIEDQELPTGVRDRRSAVPQAVAVLTAHGAVGQEFSHVIVAGVHEGQWPSLGETGSLFSQEDLIDLVDDEIHPDTPVSHTAERLGEERRLFHVATTRATDKLLVAAVHNLGSNEPVEKSRFIEEFAKRHHLDIAQYAPEESGDLDYEELPVRLLSPSSIVAELRRAVCSEESDDTTRTQAARQLARLAQAGVPGADPDEWWSTTEASTSEPLPVPEYLSPSRIEGLIACPLREIVGTVDDEAETPLALTRGTLVHAFFEALGRGVDADVARELTVEAYKEILAEPAWRVNSEVTAFERILDQTAAWVAASSGRKKLVGVEVPVQVKVTEEVGIRGRIDRLESGDDGSLYIIDLKTSKTPITQAEAAENPQLSAYQLAVSRGVLKNAKIVDPLPGEETLSIGGASLVYPASLNKKVPTRDQAARDEEQHDAFAGLLPGLAEDMQGPLLTARINPGCTHCAVRTICPVQPDGEKLTNA